MGNITTMTVFVWAINIIMFLAQVSMISMNPESINYYTIDNNLLSDHAIGNNLTPNENKLSSDLNIESATGTQESSEGTGIFFIDAIASVRNWITNKVNYFMALVMGPYNILNAMGLPAVFCGAVSLLWYGASILLLVLTIFGRGD